MADEDVRLSLTVAQLDAILNKLHKHMSVQAELIQLSCELFKALYQHQPHSPLLKQWQMSVSKLLGNG